MKNVELNKPLWSSRSVTEKLNQFSKLSEDEKNESAAWIERDLEEWALANFSFSQNHRQALNSLSPAVAGEVGATMARGLKKGAQFDVVISDGTRTARKSEIEIHIIPLPDGGVVIIIIIM